MIKPKPSLAVGANGGFVCVFLRIWYNASAFILIHKVMQKADVNSHRPTVHHNNYKKWRKFAGKEPLTPFP